MTLQVLCRALPASFTRALRDFQPAHRAAEINTAAAHVEHERYTRALLSVAGVQKVHLAPADDGYPDCVFVEDALVCHNAVALLTRSGAPSRQGESQGLRAYLQQHAAALGIKEVAVMPAPAQLDGGDVLAVGPRLLFVGSSTRTNAAGQARLAEVFASRRVIPVRVPSDSLHLKSLITFAGEEVGYIYHASHDGEAVLRACLAEAPAPATAVPDLIAANVLRIAQTIFYSPAPGSQPCFDRLSAAHPQLSFQPLPMPTFALADGALTCCSVLIGGAKEQSC